MCLQICEYYSRSSGRWPYSDHVEGFAMPYTPAHARCHDDSFQVRYVSWYRYVFNLSAVNIVALSYKHLPKVNPC